MTRRALPNRRLAKTFELEVAGLRYTVTVGRFEDDRSGWVATAAHKFLTEAVKQFGRHTEPIRIRVHETRMAASPGADVTLISPHPDLTTHGGCQCQK
jgi:hypothetical protein